MDRDNVRERNWNSLHWVRPSSRYFEEFTRRANRSPDLPNAQAADLTTTIHLKTYDFPIRSEDEKVGGMFMPRRVRLTCTRSVFLLPKQGLMGNANKITYLLCRGFRRVYVV